LPRSDVGADVHAASLTAGRCCRCAQHTWSETPGPPPGPTRLVAGRDCTSSGARVHDLDDRRTPSRARTSVPSTRWEELLTSAVR
jgi:hypothetical protein